MYNLLTQEINFYATEKSAKRTKCSLYYKDPLMVNLTLHVIARARSFLPCSPALQMIIAKNEITFSLFFVDFLSRINFRLEPW
jgi:hypothetical protein